MSDEQDQDQPQEASDETQAETESQSDEAQTQAETEPETDSQPDDDWWNEPGGPGGEAVGTEPAPPPPPPPPAMSSDAISATPYIPAPGAAPPPGYTQAPQSNGMAVASLVLGILGAVFFWVVWPGVILGILAVVFGAIGRSRAAAGAPYKGVATAGLILGIAAIGLALLAIALFVNVAREVITTS